MIDPASAHNPIGLRSGNPMLMVVRATLLFEVIGFGLAIPVMIQVSGVAVTTAVVAGVVGAVLPLIAVGLLRFRWGWAVAWLAQLVGLALGILTPGMYAVGGMFAVLFAVAVVLGKRLENGTRDGATTPVRAPDPHR